MIRTIPSQGTPMAVSLSASGKSDVSNSSSSTTNSSAEKKQRKFSTLISTLRGHISGISQIEVFYVPSNVFYTDEISGEKVQLLIATLLTADENGWIIWWDLNTRRPIGCFQGHNDSPVLTLKQLGLTWEKRRSKGFKEEKDEVESDNKENNEDDDYDDDEEEEEYCIPHIDPELFGCIISHGKDGEIKIWRLIDLIPTPKESLYSYRNSVVLQKKLPPEPSTTATTDMAAVSNTVWKNPRLLFQMPVNMLNFSNVDINSRGKLITPATQQSEMFDIYHVDLSNDTTKKDQIQTVPQDDLFQFDNQLRRISKAVNPIELIDEQRLDFHIQHIQDTETGTNRQDFGIIMKVQWLNKGFFAIGYESGHVLTYQITEDSKQQVLIRAINSTHFPNPILSLTYDQVNHRLLSSSANDKLIIDNLGYLNDSGKPGLDITEQPEYVSIHKVKHKGIADTCIFNDNSLTSDTLGLVTWDGYARFFDLSKDNKVLSSKFKLKKSTPAINVTKLNDELTNELEAKHGFQEDTRSSHVSFCVKQRSYSVLKQKRRLEYINGVSKVMIRKREEDMFGYQWAFVCFKDSRVTLYHLN